MHFFNDFPYLMGVISFFVGLCFMPVVIKIAKQKNFVVKPNKRTSHKGAVPNVGGINILISFCLTLLLFSYNAILGSQFLIIGIFIIVLVGFTDDLIDLRFSWKFIGEFASAFFLIVLADVRLTSLHGFLGIFEIPLVFSYLLSFFVFIVIINALNLIDGVDGLASGLSILYCLFFGIYFTLAGHIGLASSAFILVGSLAVFFIYNVFGNKRKIFMGDSGSLLLGYMMTFYVFLFCEYNATNNIPHYLHIGSAPAVAICVLAVPLFDTLRVVCTRIKKGVSPFYPDKNHIHHLLLKTGLKHREVTVVLLSVTMAFIGLGILGRNWKIEILTSVVFFISCALTYVLWGIINKKNRESNSKSHNQTGTTS